MALEIPATDAMARYRRTARAREAARRTRIDRRRQRAQAIARSAAQRLMDDFGAQSVLLFGSLARADGFHERSDIDLAVTGLPPTLFFAAWRAIDDLAGDIEIQLVDLDRATGLLRRRIEETGVAP
jgi:predicted nucleotidyltransferase